ISIAEGARVEIKGVQDLDLMAEIVNREVTRQLALIDIKKELEARNAEVLEEIHDLDELLEDTESKILKSAETIKAVVLKGYDGLIGREVQPGRRFGTEIASYAKKRGVAGIFHSDELPAYGITQDEVDKVTEFLNIGDDDAFIIVAHDEDIAISALEEVKRRAKLGLEGVVEETRKALDDGNTEYMRPLPTANRMYLETDIPLFKITSDRIEPIANNLPELPDVKQARIIEEYKLSEDLATQLVKRQEADMFEAVLADVDVDATPVASLLAYDLREIKREGHDVGVLTLDHFKGIFTLLADGKIAKDSVRKLAVETIKTPDADIAEIAEKSNLTMMSEEDVHNIISEIVANNEGMVKERQMGAMGPLMGMCMKQLKGKADGGLVNKIVREEIQKLI
ncbi:MAG: Glu-tRNA(Gln) amidotransferase subunit GatE, partial [Methanobrevibacter sp.]|nr:Glu-tRNA(Gln) amidotransferase subunit GatE [Methanobrevibacter sp.]